MAKLKVKTEKLTKTDVDPGELAQAIVNNWASVDINSFMFTFMDEINGRYEEDALIEYLNNFGFHEQLQKWAKVKR